MSDVLEQCMGRCVAGAVLEDSVLSLTLSAMLKRMMSALRLTAYRLHVFHLMCSGGILQHLVHTPTGKYAPATPIGLGQSPRTPRNLSAISIDEEAGGKKVKMRLVNTPRTPPGYVTVTQPVTPPNRLNWRSVGRSDGRTCGLAHRAD